MSAKPCVEIRALNDKTPFGKEKKISNIKDKYSQYNECESLKALINEYNTAIDTHDNAVNEYNILLDQRKLECRVIVPTDSCRLIETANKKLMALYYKIEQGGQSDLSSYKSEYAQIKKEIEKFSNREKCKSYEACKAWQNGIEKLLK